MNKYRFSIHTSTGLCTNVVAFAETEKAARLALTNNGVAPSNITSVTPELTSKEPSQHDQLEALQKIKAIIACIGGNTPLASAFEDVFAVAELNIRGNLCSNPLADAANTREELKTVTERNYALARDLIGAQDEIETLKSKLANSATSFPSWLHGAIYAVIRIDFLDAQAQMENAADTMATYVATPDEDMFSDAAAIYREAKEYRDLLQRILDGLENVYSSNENN